MKFFSFALVAILQAYVCNACHLTKDRFHEICAAAGYQNVPADVYDECFAKETEKYSCDELAMIITQFIHESGGFQFKEEVACQSGNHCAGQYVDQVGHKDKSYYGRGFIQLTWGANYKAAGEALGVDLLEHPELVSQTDMACKTSLWYWDTNVHPRVGDCKNFGVTTKAINGALECGSPNERAHHRYEIYQKVARTMGVDVASERGCYN